MTRIGARTIYFTGSDARHVRVVWRKDDGTYWIKWYGVAIEVDQMDDDCFASAGWKTVDTY